MKKVRVLLVDDQRLFREGLRTLLSLQPDFEIVGEANDGEEALRVAMSSKPDVVLMDLKMPVLDGVAATRRMRASQPSAKVIALTTFDDDEMVFEGLRAGAIGYLLKDAPSEKLVEAIRAASRGEAFLVPSIAAKVLAELARLSAHAPEPANRGDLQLLSDREREVLRRIGHGASNKDIAQALGVAEGTVKNHVTSILQKLKVEDRTQAALRARELGLV